MDNEEDWKVVACEKQLQYFETLGSRQYDEIDKTNLFLLKKQVGFATCGKPNDLPDSSNYYTGYSQKKLDSIIPICRQIIEKSDQDPIQFGCMVLILFHKNKKKENEMSEMSVFKVGTKSGVIFIDIQCRVYENWKSFMDNNKLPACEYCFPDNGEYHNNKEKVVNFAKSPACGLMSKTADCLDTVGSVACVGAAAVIAAGMFVTVAPAAMAAAGTASLCTASYSLARSTHTLYDRKKHDQSIGLKDKEARGAWISIASSAAGAATLKVVANVQKAGKPLSKVAQAGLHALNVSSVLFSGFGFVESLILCKEKHEEGTLSKKDIFDLTCELLFLFNAIASAKATSQLVNNMNSAFAEAPQSQRKLTKTQKRNLRKRAAKRRAKGLSPIVKETENGNNIATPLKILLVEAARCYAPRIEAITLSYHSIAHDVTCWQRKEISDLELLKNIFTQLVKLHNKFKEEIQEVTEKVIKYFSSINFDAILDYIFKLYETAADEIKTIFCNKIINIEDELDQIINDAEEEIRDLHTKLDLQTEENSSESMILDPRNAEDEVEELNQETQSFLTSCSSLISNNSLSCDDINDFQEILDSVKSVIVYEFKKKVNNYISSLEAAKSACGESFNIEAYHEKLNLKGDISQYFFNEILQEMSVEEVLYKIKNKCQEMRKERRSRTTPVWEAAANNGIFHYYGQFGAGYLDKMEFSDILRDIVSSPLDGCNWVIKTDEEGREDLSGTFMIEFKSEPFMNILVYQNLTEQHTAYGMITVIK